MYLPLVHAMNKNVRLLSSVPPGTCKGSSVFATEETLVAQAEKETVWASSCNNALTGALVDVISKHCISSNQIFTREASLFFACVCGGVCFVFPVPSKNFKSFYGS